MDTIIKLDAGRIDFSIRMLLMVNAIGLDHFIMNFSKETIAINNEAVIKQEDIDKPSCLLSPAMIS